MGPALRGILLACAALFLAAQFAPDFAEGLGLTPRFFWEGRAYWQVFTYQFVHYELWHLGLNLYVLWMLGPEVEGVWGSRRFLLFYLSCGLGAGLAAALSDPRGLGTTIGASGAISGVLVAHALLYPDRRVLLFFFIPMRLGMAVWAFAALEALFQVFGILPGISHTAHLGGFVTGYVLVKAADLSQALRNRHYRRKLERLRQSGRIDDFSSTGFPEGVSQEPWPGDDDGEGPL